jgi:hypothetical protein
MSGDRSTFAGSPSLCVLRKPSVVGPTCVALAWPRHGTALVSLPCTVRPSFFPGTVVGSRFSPSSPYQTLPLVSFLAGTVARAPPCRTNPIPSFLLSPTQACTGGAPWRHCSPPSDSLVIRLHATPTTGALHHLLRSLAISATLFASPPFPPLDLK